MLLLLRQRDLRRIFETITEMIQQLIKILTTIMFFVLIFAGLGVVSNVCKGFFFCSNTFSAIIWIVRMEISTVP